MSVSKVIVGKFFDLKGPSVVDLKGRTSVCGLRGYICNPPQPLSVFVCFLSSGTPSNFFNSTECPFPYLSPFHRKQPYIGNEMIYVRIARTFIFES